MSGFLFLLTNACTLLTFSYLMLKLHSRLGSFERVAVPLLAGAASVLLILQPLPYGGVVFDLRSLPLIMAGLYYGYPVSMLSAILPLTYSYIVEGGFSGAMATVQDIIIPSIISSFFHSRLEHSGYSIISLHRSWQMALVMLTIHLIGGWFMGHPWITSLHSAIWMFVISYIFLTILILINNEENRAWLMQRSLQLKANQDSLTRLPNLRSFMEIAERTIQRERIAILMVDIDNFKHFNDRWGHLEGDRLLREVGQRLMQRIGERDYIARYGGEEFIILSPTDDLRYLCELSRQLCDDITHLSLDLPELPNGFKISISIGLSVCTHLNESLRQLIAEADEALYESKNTGKNRYTFHHKLGSVNLHRAK
ncbi:diguanylate cyclase [Paenibacillus sp. J2TS4]|uniref:diguanylate cyclase n=1 Tax=Paenibacillus sp. J2TS4 TaxID=2807194 RepID=UPI001B02EF40|nr:diguanylate cyclase [Paenibacillus sp. J2TS4]GIP31125.1 hypothetical protein J2TS4_03350 [Paenibacillus sp. J2TS4]